MADQEKKSLEIEWCKSYGVQRLSKLHTLKLPLALWKEPFSRSVQSQPKGTCIWEFSKHFRYTWKLKVILISYAGLSRFPHTQNSSHSPTHINTHHQKGTHKGTLKKKKKRAPEKYTFLNSALKGPLGLLTSIFPAHLLINWCLAT